MLQCNACIAAKQSSVYIGSFDDVMSACGQLTDKKTHTP